MLQGRLNAPGLRWDLLGGCLRQGITRCGVGARLVSWDVAASLQLRVHPGHQRGEAVLPALSNRYLGLLKQTCFFIEPWHLFQCAFSNGNC